MESNGVPRHKCLIIGSGPAGYTAAIYAARANLSPVLYTGMQPGGQLTITTEVENFPGYPDGVRGPDMMEDLRKQAERFGTTIHYEQITKVDFTGPVHRVWTEAGQLIEANSVIISTGASAKWLGLPNEQHLAMTGGGVSACAVCDGFFYRGQEVAIVGGGDTAAEEALYLANLCKHVHMFVRRDELRASKIMQKRLFQAENITVYWNTEVREIIGQKEVEGIRVENNQTHESLVIPIKGFFVAIGHQPNTDIFKGWVEMDETGYIQTICGTTKTNVKGVFASGDAQDKHYRQAITAAGTGCMAAMDAERYLAEEGVEVPEEEKVAGEVDK